MNAELRAVQALIRQRKFTEARHALDDYLALDDTDADAWYLRSFVELDREQKVSAARRALKLDKKHAEARQRLVALKADAKRERKPSAAPVVIIFLLLIVLVGLGFYYLWQNNPFSRPQPPLPTEVQLVNLLPTEDVDAPAEPTDALAEPTDIPTGTPEPTDAETATPTSAPATQEPPTQAPPTQEPATQESAPTQESVNAPAPGGNPFLRGLGELFGGASDSTSGAAQPAAPQPTQPAASLPTLPSPSGNSADSGADFSEPQSIDLGQLLVVDVARPADDFLADMELAAPPAPDGQEWLVIELLLICTSPDDCAIEPSALNVADEDGNSYAPSDGLGLEPTFGSDETSGQQWGYLAFLVPQSAGDLTLRVSSGGQTYTFALA